MTRGYLWQNLHEEIVEEFSQSHPLARVATGEEREDLLKLGSLRFTEPYSTGLCVRCHERMAADGRFTCAECYAASDRHDKPSPAGPRRVGRALTVTESVRLLRARRLAEGKCIDCEKERDPESKNHCPAHREADRLRAAKKREKKMMASADYKHRIVKDGEEIADEWNGINFHFVIHTLDPKTYESFETDGYILTRENEDGSLYAFRVKAGKNGGTWAWIDRWSHQVSKRLRKGESLVDICKEEMHQQYDPSGATNVPGIARCDSPTDLVCKWLLIKYAPEVWAELGKGKVQP